MKIFCIQLYYGERVQIVIRLRIVTVLVVAIVVMRLYLKRIKDEFVFNVSKNVQGGFYATDKL